MKKWAVTACVFDLKWLPEQLKRYITSNNLHQLALIGGLLVLYSKNINTFIFKMVPRLWHIYSSLMSRPQLQHIVYYVYQK